MKRVSVADVRRGYTSEKARNDLVSNLWGYIALRPVSLLLSPLFINLGFGANAITALGLVPLLSGLALLALGGMSSSYFTIGALLVNLWYLLDHIDGNVARFRGKSSRFGALFDFSVGMIVPLLLPICAALGLYFLSRAGHPAGVLGIDRPSVIWLIVGVSSSLARLFRRTISLKTQMLIPRSAGEASRKVSVLAVMPRAIVSFEFPLLLLASVVGAMDAFLVIYAVYNVLACPAMLALAYRKALQQDRRVAWQQEKPEGEE